MVSSIHLGKTDAQNENNMDRSRNANPLIKRLFVCLIKELTHVSVITTFCPELVNYLPTFPDPAAFYK